ncbi:hypothetical protein LSCM1_02169 [Leishmania martiniquensis]|uniref:Uncharacterized protein n=1 Tax=Leishmania martiniquensis TaxID=1580590 RepID=A0A836H1D7_9TRYP|nr:hypothetical protein LSCM1_02169 [Leishmania martiniquensis]
MSVSAPRLPRLGGHQPAPTGNTSTAPPLTPQSPAPFSRAEPTDVSRAPDRMSRPRIDVGYDEDGVPLASHGSGDLSGVGASESGAALLQQPRPSSRPLAARPSSSARADAWKASMKEEVLHGKAPRQGSPDVAAAVPRQDLYSTLAEEDDIVVDYADEESAQARELSDGGGGAPLTYRYSVMMPGSGVAALATPPVPVLAGFPAPKSPVSASSSIATDTPRSILRQSGATSSKTLRSSSRRISFVGISPPRPKEPRGGREGAEESGNESDEYESAEPSLHYDTDMPPSFVTATPPRHARKVHSRDASSSDNHHDNHQQGECGSNRASSPVPVPQQSRASSSLSSKSPRPSSRSPTHSPPRDSGGRYTNAVGPQLPAAVTAPSAPPPPEEEGDEVTLDVAPQLHTRAPPHLQRCPEKVDGQRRARSPSMGANGRDEDVLTQPHHRSDTDGMPVAAAPVVRCPPRRQRWPSDAYQDDPPTEASHAQRAHRYRRESLDPEDDMGSSGHTDSSPTGSDDSSPSHSASPLKAHQEERQAANYRPALSSPTSSSHPTPPIRPLPCRGSEGASELLDGNSSRSSSSSGSQRSLEQPSAPPSMTQREDAHEPGRGGRSHEQDDGYFPRGVEKPLGQLSEMRAAGATALDHRDGVQVGKEKREQDSWTAEAVPPPRREASYVPSAGYSPSTITDHSSGQSMADDLSAAVKAADAQEPRQAPSPLPYKHVSNANTRTGAPKTHQRQPKMLPSAVTASTAEAPARRPKEAISGTAIMADEPQVYVDPLQRERRHRHELARQESLPHLEHHAQSAGAARDSPHVEEPRLYRRHPGRHALRRGLEKHQLTTSDTVSLRDVIMRYDVPTAKAQRGTPSDQSAVGRILRLPSGERQLQLHHGFNGDDDATRARTPGAAATETSVASSLSSSGGVPANELVWDAPTSATRTGRSASPSVSPRASSAPALDTPYGHKVFRKKLVVVVRRKKKGAAPSENDPVIQMSMLPFKEGAAALLKSSPSPQASPQQQRARSTGAQAAGTSPALVKFIDHVERGWSASVSSRCTSRASHRHDQTSNEMALRRDGSDDHAGDDEIGAGARRRFRRALSVLSSRAATPRASISPSSTRATVRPDSIRSYSPQSRNAASEDRAPSECRTGIPGEAAELYNGAAARRRSSGRRRGSRAATVSEKATSGVSATSRTPLRSSHGGPRHSNEELRHRATGEPHQKWRRRHKHEDDTLGSVEHRQRSRSAAAMPSEPYHAIQSDEYYGAADMAKDVVALLPLLRQERIGITPMPIQLLPRLVLRSQLSVSPSLQDSHHPHSNINAGQRSSGAWSASDDEAEKIVGRITEGTSGGRRSRSLRLQCRSGTQTDTEAGESVPRGSARSGMPLLSATPVQRIPPAGLIEGTQDSEHLGNLLAAAGQRGDAGGTPSPLATVDATVGEDSSKEERVPTDALCVETFPPGDGASVVESPALFVKRVEPLKAAAQPVTSHISLMYGSGGDSVSRGGGEGEVFGGDAVAARAATAVSLLSVDAAHETANLPQRTAYHVGNAAHATMHATAHVPLFVPPLTVHNVSQLSHDWQSTLRESSSKAKRDAMEKFLIASAEAGAAAASAAVTTGVSPYGMCADDGGEPHGAAVGAEAPSKLQRRAQPAQARQGLRREKPHGNSVAAAAVSSAWLSAPALSLQPGPQSFGEVECNAQQSSGSSRSAAQPAVRETSLPAAVETKSAQVAALVPAGSASISGSTPAQCKGGLKECPKAACKHHCQQDRLASPTPPHPNSDAAPLAAVFDVATLSTAAADSPRERNIDAEKRSKAGVADIFSPPLSTASRLQPPTPAEEKQRARRDKETVSCCSRRRSPSSRGKAAVIKEAVQTGTNGAGVSSARKSPPLFSIVEPITEAHEAASAERATKRRGSSRHRQDERRKHSSRHGTNASSRRSPSSSPSQASQLPRARRKKGKKAEDNGDRKQKRRKHGHERHGRHSRSRARSRSTHSGDATVFGMDEDSDVDSDFTTSMEFQLSRLLLLREAAALTGRTHSAAADVSRRGAHREDKAARAAAKKAAAAKRDKHHRHRSHSSKAKKAQTRSKRAAKRRSTSSAGATESLPSNAAGEKETAEKRKRHRATPPPNLEPLPPPPSPQRSRVLPGYEAAASRAFTGDAADPIFASGVPFTDSDSRCHRDDYAASASPRVTFEGDVHSRSHYPSARPYGGGCSIYSGSRSEEAEAASARHRMAARTGSDWEAPYERCHPRSRGISPRCGQRLYAASATSRWADAFWRADRPPSRFAAAPEGPALGHRSYSNPSRPSTRWNDYVRDAEHGAASRPWASPYTRARHSQYLSQRRRSSSTGITTARERAGGDDGSGGGSQAPAQLASRTYSDTYTSRRGEMGLFEDIDDIPIRQYFNDNGQGDSDERGCDAGHGATSAYERRRSRSDISDPPPTARPSPAGDYERSRAAAEKRRDDEDDLLVSTPLHKYTKECWRRNSEDSVRPRQSPRPRSRTTRLPPPPSPPQASTSTSAAETGSLFAAIPRSGALPIVTEHTVTDAQTAEDFVRGVKEVITALQQYRNLV